MKKFILTILLLIGTSGIAFAQSDWSAVPITKTIVDNQTLIVEVEFRNSVTPSKNHTRSYEVASPTDIESVKSSIANHIKRLEKIEDIYGKVTLDVAIDLTPAPQPTPTPEQQAIQACRNSYSQYKAGLEAVNIGILQANDPMVTNAKTAVENNCPLPQMWEVFYSD